jgi:hypothetical protein
LFYGDRVKHTGQSPKGYGSAVRRAAAMGAVTVVKGAYANGKEKVSVVLRDAFDKPATLARPEPRKSGGARPAYVAVCADCGPAAGVTEQKATTYVCECGATLRTVKQPNVDLVRSTEHPADCYPAETEVTTGAILHRTETDAETTAESATGAILPCKVYGRDLETHPLPVQGKIAPVAATALDTVYQRAELTTPKLDRAIPCHSRTGGCSQQGYCAKQGRCPFTPTAPGATTTSNYPGGAV